MEAENEVQREIFDQTVDIFEPPYPEGVPERLERIVAAGNIAQGDTVLDVGAGTGALTPLIRTYGPSKIYACDLSAPMLDRLKAHYPDTEVVEEDARDLAFPDHSIDVVFMNAVYPNIADKEGAFHNVSRMMKTGGRLVISHPLGKSFIDRLRKMSSFHLDDFPGREEAGTLLEPYGFDVACFIDEPELYILVALKKGDSATGGKSA